MVIAVAITMVTLDYVFDSLIVDPCHPGYATDGGDRLREFRQGAISPQQ